MVANSREVAWLLGQSHHLFQSSHSRRFYTNGSSVIIAEYADNFPFRHTTAASSEDTSRIPAPSGESLPASNLLACCSLEKL
jgi:hypothetical protein